MTIEASLESIAKSLAVIAMNSGSAVARPTGGTEAAADAAGDSKPRGRPPGSTNKPKPAEAAPSAAPAAETTDTAATDIPDVTVAQKAVTDTIKAGFRDEVLKVLAKYGAKNASGVKADDRAAFIAELASLTDAAG